MLNHLAFARDLGELPSDLARRSWLDLASTGSIWLPRAPSSSDLGAQQRAGWLDLAANARPGRPATPGWLDLAANECPNDCPIETISKKNRCAAGRPASTMPASLALQRFFHASNLVLYIKGRESEGGEGIRFCRTGGWWMTGSAGTRWTLYFGAKAYYPSICKGGSSREGGLQVHSGWRASG